MQAARSFERQVSGYCQSSLSDVDGVVSGSSVFHSAERVETAKWWSDPLDTVRDGADIVRFPGCEAM